MRIVRKNSRRRGMAATEYVIGLVLIAVGSIGIFSVFGQQIKGRLGMITAAIGGNSESFQSAKVSGDTAAAKVDGELNKGTSMKGEVDINLGAGAATP